MDFSKLIEDDLTSEWVRNIIQKLSPYPYLADVLVIFSSFATGALLSAMSAQQGETIPGICHIVELRSD